MRGHEFTRENTLLIPKGRACRECRRLNQKKNQANRTITQRKRRAAARGRA